MAKDLLVRLGDYRQLRVTDLSDTHVERLIKTLQDLENEVIALASKIPTTATTLNLKTTLALEIRPQLKQLIDQTYLNTVYDNVREYDKVANWLVATLKKYPIPNEFKQLTELDYRTIQQLQRVAFTQFEDLGNQLVTDLANEVYASTISGRSTADMTKTLRGKINGIYQQSDSTEAQELVDFIANNPDKPEQVRTAIDRLQTIYGRDRLGENFRRYATQLVQDALMSFDGQFTKYRADELGMTSYKYTGTLVRDSRQFCIDHLDQVYTEDEIREIWNTETWQGKAQGDPFAVRGGYNCRHHWQPVNPDWLDSNGNYKLD